jgi:hypothetical protein
MVRERAKQILIVKRAMRIKWRADRSYWSNKVIKYVFR